jgi:hypothetical protein
LDWLYSRAWARNTEKEEFSFETRPDKEGARSVLWIWPVGHEEDAAPQRPGELAEFSPNHAWMALTERIDQNGDESDRDYHLHFARRINDSVYKYERKIDAELENKVLSQVLGLYGYQRSDCQRYSIMPCGHWTTDSQSIAVVSNIQVRDRKDKEFFETIDGWKGIYNLEKGEVFQVLDTGKISVAPSNTAPTSFEIRSNGEEAQTLWCWQGNIVSVCQFRRWSLRRQSLEESLWDHSMNWSGILVGKRSHPFASGQL